MGPICERASMRTTLEPSQMGPRGVTEPKKLEALGAFLTCRVAAAMTNQASEECFTQAPQTNKTC